MSEDNLSRRRFLQGVKGWSAAAVALVLAAGPAGAPPASAAWVNGGGVGGWVNRRGGGWINGAPSWLNAGGGWVNGGGWINGPGGWINGGGGGGTGWVNVAGGGGWVNRRGGGGGWINRR